MAMFTLLTKPIALALLVLVSVNLARVTSRELKPDQGDQQHGRRSLLSSCPTIYHPPGSTQSCMDSQCCCYSTTWWTNQAPAQTATCLTGKFSGTPPDPASVLGDCGASTVGGIFVSPKCNFIEDGPNAAGVSYSEQFYDAGPGTCETNSQDTQFGTPRWTGADQEVYNKNILRSNNNEIVWADVTVDQSLETGLQNCGGSSSIAPSYSVTGSYSYSWGWNIGISVPASIESELTKNLAGDVALTAQYTKSWTKATSAGATIPIGPGEFGTATKGVLVHHFLGAVEVTGLDILYGCKKIRIDNVAIDSTVSEDNDDFPTDFGTESKPCNYPLLSGKTS